MKPVLGCNYILPLAEATCVSMIRTARAVQEEIKSATPASVERWARCGVSHSERDVQRVVKSQRLALPVPITDVCVGGKMLPFIRSVDWLGFLVTEVNQWHRLAGLERPNEKQCEHVWSNFWRQFKALEPDHQIFTRLTEDELSHTAACYFHLDEGRTLKRAGIMIMSFHSALGFGFKKQAKRSRDGGPLRFRVNYTGSTLTNRFLLAAIPKKYYEKNQQLLDDVLEMVAKDFKSCIDSGATCNGRVHRICILGVKADWPAHVRCGKLLRSYNHGPKNKSAKQTNSGVCHLKEAGMPGILFEEIGCSQPVWKCSVGASLPWATTPQLLRHLPHNAAFPASYFKIDIWHTVHMGIGKSFISSAMTLALELFRARGVVEQLEQMTASYHHWCRQNKVSPYITKITKDTLKWKKKADEPAGAWNKGSLTTQLCSWFEAFCWQNADRIEDGTLLHLSGQAVTFLNRFIHLLYRSEVFVDKERGMFIARQGTHFMYLYRVLAEKSFESQRQLFPLLPKVHTLDHIVHSMVDECKIKAIMLNPMIMGNQQEEDFIGRPSRISRRVSPRLSALRTLQRFLITARAAWAAAGMIH